jgi:hypothetical protein
MPCHPFKHGEVTGFICSRVKTVRCVSCGRPSKILCDYPVKRDGKETTCSRACCLSCSEHVGENKDYCLAHANYAREKK